MKYLGLKYFALIPTGYLFLFLSCFNIGDRQNRVNPFDPNGTNWFPPTIAILDNSIEGIIHDTVTINIKTSDKNGTVQFLKWFSTPEAIDIIDSITGFNDSIVTNDTTVSIQKIPIDTTDTFDTTLYDTVISFVKLHEIDSTLYILTITTDSIDTLKYELGSDTSLFHKIDKVDSLMLVFKVVASDSIHFKFITETNIHKISVDYLYTSRLIFDRIGLYTLFVQAIDNDGVESIYTDSVQITIVDTTVGKK